MNTSTTTTRVIDLDLEVYTDGDPELKRELITLMIDNVRELQQSLKEGIDLFRKISHKIKPTISMLNDKDLTEAIEEIKLLTHYEQQPAVINSFQNLCNDIVNILEKSEA